MEKVIQERRQALKMESEDTQHNNKIEIPSMYL